MPIVLKNIPSQRVSCDNDVDTLLTSDILQKHSINSLFDQSEILNDKYTSDTMSISEMFGLNSPRGLLDFGNSWTNGPCTPPANNPRMQWNFDETNFSSPSSQMLKHKSPLNVSMTTDYYSASSPGSDACGNNSPVASSSSQSLTSFCSDLASSTPIEAPACGYNFGSRSNSPESDSSAVSYNIDGSFSDLLQNTLTLNANLARKYLENERDLQKLQNLQMIQVLKNLQNSNAAAATVFDSIPPTPVLEKWSFPSSPAAAPAASAAPLGGGGEPDLGQLDRAARFHRSAATVCDPTCTWSGVLPPRSAKTSGYSCKVFLGGVPWDISEQSLMQTFKPYGNVKVEWPGKEAHAAQPKGYVYVIFESDKNVRALLQACTCDYSGSGNYYFKISSRRMKAKEVQVIPWVLSDANCTKSTTQKLDPTKTVFVGALHGLLNAESLAKIMNDLFDGVVYTGLDTDKYKYPIGSGRVTFNNPRSYMRAIAAAFIEIKTAKFCKKVQVDPYLEDSLCSVCGVQQGPYFCRDVVCFRYFCRICWQWQHNYRLHHHKPLMRNSKNGNVIRLVPNNRSI